MSFTGGRPIVALNCDVFPALESDSPPTRQRAGVWLEYVDPFLRRGASPIILPPGSTLEILDGVDGVVLIGSDDYRLGNGEAPPIDFTAVDPRREESDLALSREALRRDLPLLAICGGFQLVTLVSGGTIYGDLPSEYPTPVQHSRGRTDGDIPAHEIEWEGDRRLPNAPPGRYSVNSYHHQAVRSLPPGWRTIATATDGVIEAGFGPGRFQCGVQWHPERDPGVLSRSLLDGFMAVVEQFSVDRNLAP